MIAFVQDAITKEKLSIESPQELLIINRSSFRIFLSLEIPIDFVKLRLVHYFFSINIVTVSWFIHSFNVI